MCQLNARENRNDFSLDLKLKLCRKNCGLFFSDTVYIYIMYNMVKDLATSGS